MKKVPRNKKADNQLVPTFVVPNERLKREALINLVRMLPTFYTGLSTTEFLLSAGIKIFHRWKSQFIRIEQRQVSSEDAYTQNEQTVLRLVDTRNSLVCMIQELLNPVVRMVDSTVVRVDQNERQIDSLVTRLDETERRIETINVLLKKTYNHAPNIPPMPEGKEIWRGSIKSAAMKVIDDYNKDEKARKPRYSSLTNAAYEFHKVHIFVKKPQLTREQFYENVKKYYGGT